MQTKDRFLLPLHLVLCDIKPQVIESSACERTLREEDRERESSESSVQIYSF